MPAPVQRSQPPAVASCRRGEQEHKVPPILRRGCPERGGRRSRRPSRVARRSARADRVSDDRAARAPERVEASAAPVLQRLLLDSPARPCRAWARDAARHRRVAGRSIRGHGHHQRRDQLTSRSPSASSLRSRSGRSEASSTRRGASTLSHVTTEPRRVAELPRPPGLPRCRSPRGRRRALRRRRARRSHTACASTLELGLAADHGVGADADRARRRSPTTSTPGARLILALQLEPLLYAPRRTSHPPPDASRRLPDTSGRHTLQARGSLRASQSHPY